MNKELVRILRKKMHIYATKVNDLITKYNSMKANGASTKELNAIAIEAHDYNSKYSEVKSEYEGYVFRYERYVSLEKTGGEKYKDAHTNFVTYELNLLFKYELEEKLTSSNASEVKDDNVSEKEETKEIVHEESYTHHKPKKGSKLLAGALIFASALGFGYGLSACSSNINNPAIVDIDTGNSSQNDEDVTKDEPKNEDKTTMPELNPEDVKTPEQKEDIKEDPKQEEPKQEETNNEGIIISEEPEEVPETNETINTNDFAYLKETASLYDTNKDDKQELEKIEKFQKVLRISTDGNYDYVQTEDLQYGYIESSKLDVLPDMYVEVDISDQTVELYKDKGVILTTLCVTGKDSTPTRIGYFPIKYKTYDTYLKGPGYKSHVYYWMPFDGGIGLHDAAWRSEFGGDIHYNSGSHGCVNMPHDAAKTIYENVSAGTKVLVHN